MAVQLGIRASASQGGSGAFWLMLCTLCDCVAGNEYFCILSFPQGGMWGRCPSRPVQVMPLYQGPTILFLWEREQDHSLFFYFLFFQKVRGFLFYWLEVQIGSKMQLFTMKVLTLTRCKWSHKAMENHIFRDQFSTKTQTSYVLLDSAFPILVLFSPLFRAASRIIWFTNKIPMTSSGLSINEQFCSITVDWLHFLCPGMLLELFCDKTSGGLNEEVQEPAIPALCYLKFPSYLVNSQCGNPLSLKQNRAFTMYVIKLSIFKSPYGLVPFYLSPQTTFLKTPSIWNLSLDLSMRETRFKSFQLSQKLTKLH